MMVRRLGLSMAFDALELVARSIFDLVRLLLLIFLTALQVSLSFFASACVDGSGVCIIFCRVSRYVQP